MLLRPRSLGLGRLDVLLIAALALVVGFMMVPSLSLRVATRRDEQRLEDMRRIEAAIERYFADHGRYPPAHESPADDDWDVSSDGDFIPALCAGGYLAQDAADPLDDAQYQYRYRVFPAGSFGCPGDRPTCVLGVRSFETWATRRPEPGGQAALERDFAGEFAWVSVRSAPVR
jgi:type II secretory pathway pseudopilin PulG